MTGERRALIDRRASRRGGRRATDRRPAAVHEMEALRQRWNRRPAAPSPDELRSAFRRSHVGGQGSEGTTGMTDDLAALQPGRDRRCDHVRAAGIWMPVPRQAPIRIETGRAPAECRRPGSALEARAAASSSGPNCGTTTSAGRRAPRQLHNRAEHVARHADALFDRVSRRYGTSRPPATPDARRAAPDATRVPVRDAADRRPGSGRTTRS